MSIRHIASFSIILLLAFLLLTCQKDETVPLNQFSIIKENVTVSATKANFKTYYEYASGKRCVLDHVNLYYSRDKEMSNPLRAKCELKADNGGTYFQVNVSGLDAQSTYYYCYEVANAINTMKTDRGSFTTNDYGTPSVTTVSVTNITGIGAVFNGNVTDGGELNVTERGFCYGTSSGSLTISGQHVAVGSGLGSFTTSVTGLSSSTTYYMRAYAKNNKGVAYGSVKTFTTSNGMPVVTTSNLTNISSTTATGGGNVTSDGGFTVTARGVCWSTTQNPTINNSHTTSGSGTGSFVSTLTGLSANTTYYVRAYATNSMGTSYGSQKSFTTQAYCGALIVTDYDGNTYNTVQIGNQCWMKQNLRTTHFANGASISQGSSGSTSVAYYYNYNSSSLSLAQRGYLYNWSAAMHGASSSDANPSGVQGICPNGWHLPSIAEWAQLADYVASQSMFVCGANSIAKALASTTGWYSSDETCTVGNNQSSNNATGFTAFPAGYWYNGFYSSEFLAEFWSSTKYSGNYNNLALTFELSSGYPNVELESSNIYFGYSVRCVRN